MRIHKEKDDEISTNRQTILELKEEIGQNEKQFEGLRAILEMRDSEIGHLKKELAVQNDRIEHGRGSAALEARASQAQKMVEKSNALYAELHEQAAKNAARAKELEIQLHEAKATGRPVCKVSSPIGDFVLCENGRYMRGQLRAEVPRFVCVERPAVDEKAVQAEIEAQKVDTDLYLRGLVLQYLKLDEKAKSQMIPVLLGVLGVGEAEARDIREATAARPRFSLFG
jgi:DNA repair exonuclease SbcCD ATPase subunit